MALKISIRVVYTFCLNGAEDITANMDGSGRVMVCAIDIFAVEGVRGSVCVIVGLGLYSSHSFIVY